MYDKTSQPPSTVCPHVSVKFVLPLNFGLPQFRIIFQYMYIVSDINRNETLIVLNNFEKWNKN